MTPTVTRNELQARLVAGKPTIVIEALPEHHYAKGHLPGAINLPHDRVRELAPGLLPRKDATIVTYCASATCRNSHIAAETLRAMGYTDVRVYEGGKQDWTDAGLALEPVARTRAA